MKANEAKSKFVYPDKLYARTENNKTLDISYAPQTLEAVEYTCTDAFIEKVSGWLKDCATFTDMNGKKCIDKEMYKATFEDFRKYMEGE